MVEKATMLTNFEYSIDNPVNMVFAMAQEDQQYSLAIGTPQTNDQIITLIGAFNQRVLKGS